MILKITHKEDKDIKDFCMWLIPYIRAYANNKLNYNMSLVNMWNEYLEKNIKTNTYYPTFIDVVNNYFRNLIVVEDNNSFIITTDHNKKAPSGHSWDYFARLINFGTLDIKGYTYFEDVFQYFAERLQMYYDEWLGG